MYVMVCIHSVCRVEVGMGVGKKDVYVQSVCREERCVDVGCVCVYIHTCICA